MKRLKLSFAAIIAVVAVALTITASAGAFKHTVLAPEDFCYTTNVVAKQPACTSPSVDLATLTCSQSALYNQKGLFNISTAGRIARADIPSVCPGNAAFCCAEIVQIPAALCPTQPQLTIDGVTAFYKINVLHCMP